MKTIKLIFIGTIILSCSFIKKTESDYVINFSHSWNDKLGAHNFKINVLNPYSDSMKYDNTKKTEINIVKTSSNEFGKTILNIQNSSCDQMCKFTFNKDDIQIIDIDVDGINETTFIYSDATQGLDSIVVYFYLLSGYSIYPSKIYFKYNEEDGKFSADFTVNQFVSYFPKKYQNHLEQEFKKIKSREW